MAGALVSTVTNVLKYRYLGPLQSQLNSEVLVQQILDLDSKNIDLDGLKAVLPLHTSRSAGIGARGEDQSLPAAGNQAYANAQFDLAYLYGRARFTGQAIQKTKSDAGAFIRVISDELDRLRDDLGIDLARQLYGDGSAKVAQCGVTSASTTVVLNDAEALTKGFLYIGMVIDIGTSANPVSVASARTINSYSLTTPSITISGAAVTTAATDFVFRAANAAASSVVYEVDAGLQALISTAANTIGGINGASAGNEYWNNIRRSVGGAVSLSALMQDLNQAVAAGAKASEMVCLTSPGIARRLFETSDFKSLVQFVNTNEMKGGFDMISFGTPSGRMQLVSDRLAPWGKLFMVDKKHVKVFSPADWDFLQRDGLTIRWDADKDAFQAVLFRYLNLGTKRRNTSVVQSGITDTNGF